MAPSLHRYRRAFQQKQQPRLGVRYLVSQSVSPGKSIHRQRGRLCYPQLHSDAGNDDPGSSGRSLGTGQDG
ncbi:MAG: 50S ribosomal protein L27 [Siphonobacter aquaeclarae]|nr:50S ribosomal protein L27 [Siphonobacter aquaeclarae]